MLRSNLVKQWLGPTKQILLLFCLANVTVEVPATVTLPDTEYSEELKNPDSQEYKDMVTATETQVSYM